MATTVENRDATRVDWKFRRGDTWTLDFTFASSYSTTGGTVTGAIDLTGSTWEIQLREGGPTGDVWTTPTVTDSAQDDGYIECVVQESVTTGAATGNSVYWYDLEQTLNDDVATPVWGKITVSADVTRD